MDGLNAIHFLRIRCLVILAQLKYLLVSSSRADKVIGYSQAVTEVRGAGQAASRFSPMEISNRYTNRSMSLRLNISDTS